MMLKFNAITNFAREVSHITYTTYTTNQIAALVGIHVNTVRFYEKIGFISKPERQQNGYRIYTALHLEQCRLIRVAMKAEVLQNGLRKKAVEVIRLCASQEYDKAITASNEYSTMIHREISSAKAAIATVEALLGNRAVRENTSLGRKDAADLLGVTTETLRTWERSGLISVAKRKNGYRVYSDADMQRLNIIKTLRCANYSLSAILRLMHGLDSHSDKTVETLLNVPKPDEDIISVCDRLILSLRSTESEADEVTNMLKTIKAKYSTIQ